MHKQQGVWLWMSVAMQCRLCRVLQVLLRHWSGRQPVRLDKGWVLLLMLQHLLLTWLATQWVLLAMLWLLWLAKLPVL